LIGRGHDAGMKVTPDVRAPSFRLPWPFAFQAKPSIFRITALFAWHAKDAFNVALCMHTADFSSNGGILHHKKLYERNMIF
jgi:hypothetical protein